MIPISINQQKFSSLDEIEALIEEDSWEASISCECGNDTFKIYTRFGETRIVCCNCETEYEQI